jgi:DNA repair ATPase RecN
MTSAEKKSSDEAASAAQRPAGLRTRIANQAEDTIGRLADDLLENPVINTALQSAFSARERVEQAQQSAMEALNLPTASDLDKLARRLRSISQRLEEVEDGVDKLGTKLEALTEASRTPASRLTDQLDRLESRIDKLAAEVAALRAQGAASGGGVTGEPPAVVG